MSDQPTKQKLWGGRFTGKTDPLMHEFNQSLKYDQRMHAADIRGSIAYAKALTRVGILTKDEESKMIQGLEAVEREWVTGQFEAELDDEDIHTANERRLSQLIGSEIGGKLHTGRSRNDQVATDMRLWLLDEVEDIQASLKALIRVIIERAGQRTRHPTSWLYPPAARSTNSLVTLFALACLSFRYDLERLQQLIPRISVLPLGSGALAGNPFAVDREFLAKELGFQSLAENSMWGFDDDPHESYLEDLIIYSTAEFGFVTLSDAYRLVVCRSFERSSKFLHEVKVPGSSIMPQKKNPDSLELLRGKSGRVFGHMAGFMMTLKGLPSTYNKDLQEDKEPLFDAVDNIAASLKIAEGVIATMEVHGDRMRQALTMDVLATDLADYLVRKGVPFRETHHVSGRAVALAEARGCQLNDLGVDDYKKLHPKFEDDVIQVFDFEASVERRMAIGGPSRKTLDRQISVLRAALQ
ncbi:putative argininosuccinate lyase [Pisolithus thermaeus]|nr:putative argininosuccinate lyase [Pisolithus thermaeus]